MAVQTITYTDKSYINENATVPAANKVQAVDMNEIKSVVNNNATELSSIISITESGNKRSIKFSNGIMINTIIYRASNIAINTAWGGIYASSTITIGNYLTAFTNVYSVNVSNTTVSNNSFCMFTSAYSTTAAPTVQLLRGSTGTVSTDIMITAYGTWN